MDSRDRSNPPPFRVPKARFDTFDNHLLVTAKQSPISPRNYFKSTIFFVWANWFASTR
jgi:hypothetical protein